MSAIWGVVDNSGNLDINNLRNMRSVYENRCKVDRVDELRLDNCYMGCAIQYVTNEAKYETLPYYDENRDICFTADCVIDNRDELIGELDGVSKDAPDGKLIYLSFLKWGIDCVKHLRGLFSFAVMDRKAKTTYLVVDQFSNRCLYYYMDGDRLVYSTLIEPIKKAIPNIKVNELYIKDFLTAPGLMPNLMSNETPYEGVMKVNCGCYLKVSDKGVDEVEYWNPSLPLGDIGCNNAKEYGAYFRSLYEECVGDAIRSAGGVAAAMSSGLDSATVATLAADKLKDKGESLLAYTYVPFDTSATTGVKTHVCDETKDVLDIVKMHDNIVPHFVNNEGKNCYGEIDKYLGIMEIPFKAYVNLPNLGEIYTKAYDEGCRVVLTGQAGNSTVSHGYIDDVLYDLYSKKKYISFLRYLNRYSKTVGESRKAALKGCISYFNHANEVLAKGSSEFKYTYDNKFLSDGVLEDYPQKERFVKAGVTFFDRVPLYQKEYRKGLYKKAIYTYLGELDTKMGLYHGVILRDPTRDMRMMQFCYHLPYKYYAYLGTPRWLIRANCRDLIPVRLMDDWMRYGVQNVDWFRRIVRDYKTLESEMKSDLDNEWLDAMVNRDEITKFLDEILEIPEERADYELQQLLFVSVAAKYMRFT